MIERGQWMIDSVRILILVAALTSVAGCARDPSPVPGAPSRSQLPSEPTAEFTAEVTVRPTSGAPAPSDETGAHEKDEAEGALATDSPAPSEALEPTQSPDEAPTFPPPPSYSGGVAIPTPFDRSSQVGADLVLVASGFEEPIDLANPNDSIETLENLWIAEQIGTVRRIVDGRPADPPVLDIRDRVEDGANEQGLLGIALHPGYNLNGRVFVNYTTHDDSTIISEFRVPPDEDHMAPRIDPATERRILSIPQPARNHNGGAVAFGPDGMLYIGTGDGGGANDVYGNGQNPTSLLGKILRIDVDVHANDQTGATYFIPPDNPFLDSTSFRPEIWAWGLRNPWKITFESNIGFGQGRQQFGLFIGDVGQGAREEIDWTPSSGGGANFGWPILEGNSCFQRDAGCDPDRATIRPILEYPHADGNGCSVTGGVVFGGTTLEGSYVYADYCSGRMWIAGRDENDEWASRIIAETRMNISGFGRSGSGAVYALAHRRGEVHMVVASEPE